MPNFLVANSAMFPFPTGCTRQPSDPAEVRYDRQAIFGGSGAGPLQDLIRVGIIMPIGV